MAGRQMRRLGQLIRQAEHSGPGAVDIGHTIADPSGGWVDVDIAGAIVPCRVPGSFRTAVRVDQDVRVSRSGGVRTITEIITPLEAPEVADVPDEADADPRTMSYILGFTDAGYSNAEFDAADWEIALYAEYVKDEDNALIDVVHDLRADVLYLQDVFNELRASQAEMMSALRDQGLIS